MYKFIDRFDVSLFKLWSKVVELQMIYFNLNYYYYFGFMYHMG